MIVDLRADISYDALAGLGMAPGEFTRRTRATEGITYNRDYWAETADGEQQPMLNVLHRDGNSIRGLTT